MGPVSYWPVGPELPSDSDTRPLNGDLSAIGPGCDEQFEFTLDLLLDAFERLRDDGWTSPKR